MDNLMTFLHIIAWGGGVIGTIVGVITLYMKITYHGSLEEIIDRLDGKVAVYYPWRFLIPAFICWAFIIAF